jgi:HEAT repeat protein
MFYTKAQLIDIATEEGIEVELTKAALEHLDTESIRTLVTQLKAPGKDPYKIDEFVWSIVDTAIEKDSLIEIAEVLIGLDPFGLHYLASKLSDHHDDQAISLLRRMVTKETGSRQDSPSAAEALIHAAYYGDLRKALSDESDLVRTIAARTLEAEYNTDVMLEALENDSVSVRRIAAWYMGRIPVEQSVDALLQMISTETDSECLRGAIWSLGVLQQRRVIPAIEPFVKHPDPLVRASVQDALTKLK